MANQPKNKPKTTKNTKKKEPETVVGPRRPLLRSRSDRVLWGVAGGLAEHLGFSPVLVRIAFVLTTFFGGAGLLAYLVLAVALPENDGEGNPVPESVWARLGKVALICILVGLALFAAASLAVLSAWTTATGHGTVVAILVAALGVSIVAVAFAQSVRRRIVPWLVTAGVVLGLPAAAIATADIHFSGSIGERDYTPTVVRDVPADGYRLGTGQMTIDLRKLPWEKGQTVHVTAHQGLGQMIVSVPKNVCIVGHATAKGGELIVGGEVSHGVDAEIDQSQPLTQAPRLDIDADLQFGQMLITDEAPKDIDSRGFDYDHHKQEQSSQRMVCGR
jgi:phage shock protein PspC (stress-responsive transcriptional regulator)